MDSDDLVVPRQFALKTKRREGNAGERWLREIPDLVETMIDRWSLRRTGSVFHGDVGLAIEVVDEFGKRQILKISWPDSSTLHEGSALTLWAGRSAAHLYNEDTPMRMLLMEKLNSRRTLLHEDIDPAITEACRVMSGLHVLQSDGFPTVLDLLNSREETLVIPSEDHGLLDAMLATVSLSPLHLLHGDLHYENVLESFTGEWKAIDPKPLLGPREFDYLPLLRNRFAEYEASPTIERGIMSRLDLIVDLTEANAEHAYLFAWYRAHLDASYARRIGNHSFEKSSMLIAAAVRSRMSL